MSKEFKAGDTITAESLNGIAEGAYTFKSGEVLTASKLNTISEAIEDKDEEIAELQAQVEELQAEIDAFPEIEPLSVTENGTYSEEGKAYSPVTVNVSSIRPNTDTYPDMQISNGSTNALVITTLTALSNNKIGLKAIAAQPGSGYRLEKFSIGSDIFTSLSIPGDFRNRYTLTYCDIASISYDQYSDTTFICIHNIRGQYPLIRLIDTP